MNKLLSVLFIAMSSLSLINEKEEIYTYRVPSTVQGAQYGVYEDEQCKNPIVDENGENVVLTVDLNEKQTYSSSLEHVYVQQIETVAGYYLDETIYDLSLENIFHVYPIHIAYKSDIYPSKFQLYKGKELLKEWEADSTSEAKDVIYEAGETYTIHQVIDDEYIYCEDKTFTLPKSIKDNYQSLTTISLQTKEYAKLQIQTDSVSNVSYQLFLDEKCKTSTNDIAGDLAISKTDETGSLTFSMEEGTYYLKQMDLPNDYYLDKTIEKVEIKNKTTTQLEFHPKWIETKVSLKDGDKLLEGEISIDNKIVISGDTVHLKRGETYTYSDYSHPLGYFKAKDKTVKISDYEEESDLVFNNYPFSVNIMIEDIDSGNPIQNGTFSIEDEGKEIFRFEGGKLTNFNSLESGKTYTIKQVSKIDGYCGNEETTFSIPEESSESQVIKVTMKKIPYVHVTSSITNSNEKNVESKLNIFSDKNCTKQVEDIYGNLINDLNTKTYDIRNGTYYLKMDVVDKKYYSNDKVVELKLNHENINQKINLKVNPVILNVLIKDEDGNDLDNYSYEVLDENKKQLFTNIKETELKDLLERDTKYYIHLTDISGQYTHTESSIEVILPSTTPETTPTVTIDCNAYISLMIESNVTGNTYGVYIDEACKKLASTIKGKKAMISSKENESSLLDLRKGTYYIKEIETSKNCYKNDLVDKIVLSPKKWKVRKSFDSSIVSLNISLKDEDGNSIKDGSYEIQDESGKVVSKFEGSVNEFTSDYLYPSSTYIIHETKAPSGYKSNSVDVVYTLPTTKPSSTPEINIIYQKEATVIPKLFHKSETQKEVSNKGEDIWKVNVALGVGLLCVFIFAGKKYIDKKKTD